MPVCAPGMPTNQILFKIIRHPSSYLEFVLQTCVREIHRLSTSDPALKSINFWCGTSRFRNFHRAVVINIPENVPQQFQIVYTHRHVLRQYVVRYSLAFF